MYLFQEIGREHKHVCILFKRLSSSKIPNTFEVHFSGRHNFHDVERSPTHVIAQHVELTDVSLLALCNAIVQRDAHMLV